MGLQERVDNVGVRICEMFGHDWQHLERQYQPAWISFHSVQLDKRSSSER